jgi:hypothetical protein
MEKKKLPGLFVLIKESASLLMENTNLGFCIKALIVSAFLSFIALLIYALSAGLILGTDATSFINENISPKGDQVSLTTNEFEDQFSRQFIGNLLVVGGVFVLLLIGVGAFHNAMYVLISLKLNKYGPIPTKDLLKQTVILAPKLLVLNSFVGLIVFVGFLLLIVPGIIFGITFMFAPIILVEEKTTIMGALAQSKNLVKGHKADLFGKMLAFILLQIPLSVVTLPFLRIAPIAGQIYFLGINVFMVVMYKKLSVFDSKDRPS